MNSALNVAPELRMPGGCEFPPANRSLSVPAAEGYERWAPMYDDAPNPLLAREERYLLPLLTDLREHSFLDLACGTGRWLDRLIARGCKAGVGIDRSMAMLRVAATKKAIRNSLTGADCGNLPFSCAAFDLAICSFALGHIGDLRPVVHELARVMKPGAKFSSVICILRPMRADGAWGFGMAILAVQIEMRSRSVKEIVRAFSSNEFEHVTRASLWLGEPEEPLFVRAGKAHLFMDACQLPAVFVCHFRRRPNEAPL